jgi:phosphodiesterase/alkaline phosphatase D-like protein
MANQALSGLEPGSTYHYRVIATNFNGVTVGQQKTFNTPNTPVISNASASETTQTQTTIGAEITPLFSPTSYQIEFGPTTAYGSSTNGYVGEDNLIHSVVQEIAGLTPGQTYHYRVSATNAIGTTSTADLVFATLSPKEVPKPPPPCKRGYVRRHGKCVKRHRKRRGHEKSRHHGRSHS